MSIDKIESWLARIQYKPEFRIIAQREWGRDYYHIRITHYAPNADSIQREKITVNQDWMLSMELVIKMKFDTFVDLLREQIRMIEMHEADEWFKVDNRKLYDPHKDDQVSA